MIELKPCPFCGGEAQIERQGSRSFSTIYSCKECGCTLETGEERNYGARPPCGLRHQILRSPPRPLSL